MFSNYDLKQNAEHKNASYYHEGNAVYLNFYGDGLYLFEIIKNGDKDIASDYARQLCDILNSIPKSN